MQGILGRIYLLLNRILACFGFRVTRGYPDSKQSLNLLKVAVLAARAKGTSRIPGFVVQVGANDGVLADPLREWLLSDGVDALLIEPLPSRFARLSALYANTSRVVCAQTAIGSATGELNLYYFSEDEVNRRGLPEYLLGLGSSSRDVILKAAKYHRGLEDALQVESVPVVRLSSMLREREIRNVFLLQVDTEGLDGAIVLDALDDGVFPTIIQFEHRHLDGATLNMLLDRLNSMGYLVAKSSCDDTIALHSELLSGNDWYPTH